ncbi:MAG: FkbM family methyltransferase [Rhodospirillales bacterium]|nr:FkbM family methyltransferase [Rhodospirillales bacterium]
MEDTRCTSSGIRLIKIDVEGMELAVLKGAQRLVDEHHPVIYAENNLRDKSLALLQWLLNADYMLYWYLPFMFSTTNFYGAEVNPLTDPAGNPTLSANILAAPFGSP